MADSVHHDSSGKGRRWYVWQEKIGTRRIRIEEEGFDIGREALRWEVHHVHRELGVAEGVAVRACAIKTFLREALVPHTARTTHFLGFAFGLPCTPWKTDPATCRKRGHPHEALLFLIRIDSEGGSRLHQA